MRPSPALAVAGVCLLVTLVLPATFPPDGGPTGFDHSVTDWVQGTFHPIDRAFLQPSQTFVLLPVMLAGAAWLAWARRPRSAATVIAAPLVALLLTEFVLKPAFGRHLTSPYVAHRFLDYPSGNTVALASVVTAFVLVARTAWARAVILAVGCVCMLGVAAGLVWYSYHWPTDIVGGICWSVAVAIVVNNLCTVPSIRRSECRRS
ncbi:phosphatase PAP2 family protein [Tsukamurella soli]|uniref:Phosphatidic acid phosphatase type 2/haloperoxidase domain-containing protein n=1 Tax=Tsukamurella soli TaxID=644556 RepID=A0ABP8JCJ0_9ACTN